MYKGKGEPLECKNSRGLSLLSVPEKVFRGMLIEEVLENAEGHVAGERFGFKKQRSCVDQIFAPRLVCEEMLRKTNLFFHGVYGSG